MSFVRRCLTRLLVLLLLPGAAIAPAQAETLAIPLVVEPRHLDASVAQALDLDAGKRGALAENRCNRVEIADPATRIAGEHLEVELHLVVHTGVELLDSCQGPAPWQGRMSVTLEPAVDISGLAVKFTPTGARLIRGDGSEGLFAKPVRALAESLILPQLGLVRVDLSTPLAAIDGLIADFLAAGDRQAAAPLADRTRVQALQVIPDGLRVTLGLAVPPPPTRPGAEPPLDPEELANWTTLEDELDGFLTTVITLLAEAAQSPDLRYELLGVLLDARYAIALALAENHPHSDPVRTLFIDAWDRLRPHLSAMDAANVPLFEDDLRLAGFIAGGDALRALDALGPEYGLDITRDGLRRLARLLLAERAPASFTPLPLEVDQRMRRLFRSEGEPGANLQTRVLNALVHWLIPAARAAATPAVAYRVPSAGQLQSYLEQIAELLKFQARDLLERERRVPDRLAGTFEPLVQATAWKESCWRQYTGTPKRPQVLKSPVGALGIMQINGRVWRGFYDLGRLADDIGYNIGAGTEILEHYLVDYAIRRGEHRQPGGDDNLVRATYAAYNGGPGQLSRYRRTDTPDRLRAIDSVFWDHYEQLRTRGWPDVSSCYPAVS
ncbi:MAG: lytic transglycosylase domain-containing protein [Pseudomonadota bacterium]|jgi:hypothetical protein